MCACERGNGYICATHCQWQGCSRDGRTHTDHCLSGDRIEPTDRCWYSDEVPADGLDNTRIRHMIRLGVA